VADGDPAKLVKVPPLRRHREGRRVVTLEDENPALGELIVSRPIATFHGWNSRKVGKRAVRGVGGAGEKHRRHSETLAISKSVSE
jgi:hypothetical protein